MAVETGQALTDDRNLPERGLTDRRLPDRHTPTAELVSQAAEQLSTLVRDEIALARAELMQKGKRAGTGAGLFGGAGLLGWYGLGLLLITAVLALDIVWPAWLAALVVAAAVLLIAGVLALVGKTQIQRAVPPIPQGAKDSITADVEKIKSAFQDGRRS
jgi:lipopolysaccharide export LptBFGC system permease protein LptF